MSHAPNSAQTTLQSSNIQTKTERTEHLALINTYVSTMHGYKPTNQQSNRTW